VSSQSIVNVIRSQYGLMQGWFEGTLAGVTDELAHLDPPGSVAPIGAQAAHVVTGLDLFLLGVAAGKQPLLMSSFADKSGVSEPPPAGGEWNEWAERVKIDLPALVAYSKAVFSEIDGYLASISDEDLQQEREFGPAGNQTILWALNILILNTFSHTGEISAIKGMQGFKGYPQ
jgi:hypothetical protein